VSLAYKAHVLADSPLGYYRLNESSGTVAHDSSGNGNNGTIAASGVSYSQVGLLQGDLDTSLAFTTSSGRVALPTAFNLNGSNAFSVEYWIKPTNANPGAGNFEYIGWGPASNGAHTGYALLLAGGASFNSLEFQVGNGTAHSTAIFSNSGIANGSVYYVAGTYDGTTLKVFLNGVQKATATVAGPMSNSGTPSIDIATASFFAGTIDEAALYQSVLSQARITDHYNAGIAANFAGGGLHRGRNRDRIRN
jgi:hypothetical protein